VEKKRILRLGLVLGSISTLAFISSCAPAGESEQGGLGDISMIIFMVLIFAMLYFVMIRPQRKRMKEHQELMGELRTGDKVITAAGIYGKIESISEDSVVLKVESGVTIRVTRDSIVAKRQK